MPVFIASFAGAVFLLAMQLDPGALVPLYRQALAEREKQFGAEHPKVARSASDLGLYLRNLGDRADALRYLTRALEIDAKNYNASSKLIAEDMENLASVSTPADALELHRKAAVCNDAEVSARNWGKVGDSLAAKGDKAGASKAYYQALTKEEAASGPAHPRVAVRLNDLAQVVEPKTAEPLVRRALTIETKALGVSNPATAVTMNNLASVLLALGKLVEAESVARQALKTMEGALGEAHPRVATITSNLAAILREKPDLSGARRFYERALAIDQAAYGHHHPEIAVDLQNLAEVLNAMGNKSEAQRLMDRAAKIGITPVRPD
jgi:tetratricopeptide (TPR) repeat protein